MPMFAEPELCAPPPLEHEQFPTTMPRCSDEEDSLAEANKTSDKNSNDALFEFWLSLFQNVAREDNDMNGTEPQDASHYFHDEEPPQCLEDPAYQHQYPGCPYTGKSDKSVQPKAIDSIPSAKPKNPMKTSADDLKQGSTDLPKIEWGKYELPARLRQLLPGEGNESGNEPTHPEVDTMEFRPSDARQGEFNPRPI